MDTLQDSPVRPHWLFTSESAKANRQISLKNQAERLAKAQALAAQKPEATNDAQPIDPLANDLTHALAETLAAYRSETDAKAKAALSQSLKNLRETYHLVTGQAKPGVIRETKPRRERDKPYSQPTPVDVPMPEENKPYGGPETG